MSETLTLTNGGTGKMYGAFAAGVVYVKSRIGDQYAAFLDLDDDGQRQAFISATAKLNREGYIEAAATFALRDAITAADPDLDSPFHAACYELAALAADDSSILTLDDQGSNIQSAMAGGGVGVTYFNPTSAARGTATPLPPIVMDLIGSYLASGGDSLDGGSGQSGDCSSPLDRAHELKRWEPF